MLFLSPIWLFGLLPWAAWAAWVVWGRRPKSVVPFLDLWRGPVVGERKRRSMGMPPVALLAMIGAVLLAILAAAGPVVGREAGAGNGVIIVDRGITMSMVDLDHANGNFRFNEALRSVRDFLGREVPEVETEDVVVVPAGGMGPTAMDDPEALSGAARAALNRGDGPVVVISDRKLPMDDPRIVEVVPDSKINNVGIALLSVRADPKPAAMVRVRNLSPNRSAKISITSGGQTIARDVDLPAEGEDGDYFFDLPAAGDDVAAMIRINENPANGGSDSQASASHSQTSVSNAQLSLSNPQASASDERANASRIDLNQNAFAVRENAWPKVEAASALPAEVQRMIEVYARLRPPGDGSSRVAVLSGDDAMPSDEPAVMVAASPDLSHPVNLTQSPQVTAGILKLETIDWSAALRGATVARPPTGDWKTIVQAGDDPVVMAETDPIRRVWIGFDSPAFARTADFVVFWNAIFDFLNNGQPEYVSQTAAKLEGKWMPLTHNLAGPEPDARLDFSADAGLMPGIFQRSDGAGRAVNAPPVPADLASPIDWRAKLRSALRDGAPKGTSLRGFLLLLAIGSICIALATWAVPARVRTHQTASA